MGMNILVANNSLDRLGGSETFTFTLIEELVRRGFSVEYFTFNFGLVSSKIENQLKVSFCTRKKYDLILANHNTCVEHLYKYGFIIQTCHGIFPKLEQPSSKSNLYVSVSTEIQNHLGRLGFPSVLIHNGLNLNRFKPIKPLNIKLRRVLSLCHSVEANKFIEAACRELNVEFLKAFKYKDAVWNIEDIMNKADLVVGLGRSAFEAMACGRPVVIYDNRSYFNSCGDGYIKNDLGFSLQNNCSGRYSNKQFTQELFIKELQKYESDDGFYFREIAEKEFNIVNSVDYYLRFWKDSAEKKKKNRRQELLRLYQKKLGQRNVNILIKILKYFHLIS